MNLEQQVGPQRTRGWVKVLSSLPQRQEDFVGKRFGSFPPAQVPPERVHGAPMSTPQLGQGLLMVFRDRGHELVIS
jgi:hypothetical protein